MWINNKWVIFHDVIDPNAGVVKLAEDKVDHPSHYSKIGKYEPIDVIEDWGLGFCLGNTVKYIARAGHKQDFEGQDQKAKTLEDLKKASWYLNRHIQNLESGNID